MTVIQSYGVPATAALTSITNPSCVNTYLIPRYQGTVQRLIFNSQLA